MIKYLQTPHHFDAARMKAEVAALSSGNWKAHYNKKHYDGDWTILPLRSILGNLDNAVSIHAGAGMRYQDTVLLRACPYLASVIDSFACEKTSVRLMKLNAGALIKEHTDHDMHMEAGEARLHIPVQTNPEVAFYIQEDRIPMQEGECWYLNLSLPHRVHNAGDTDRIHLVVDCIVNDAIRAMLDDTGLNRKDIDALPPQGPAHNEGDLRRIIEELRRLNTPASLQQAENLEASLLQA